MARSTVKIDSTRTYGIEIEAYNVPAQTVADALVAAGISCTVQGYNHNVCVTWKVVSDSSIQGVNSFELVSPILVGQDGLRQIDTVCTVLTQLNAKINKSCGLHVHHGAQDLTLGAWKNLVKYYIKFEPVIDSLMPLSRRASTNLYCASLAQHFPTLDAAWTAINSATDLHMLSSIAIRNCRYHKLNLTAFWRHGTVEFRQHSGTIEAEKITHWISLTQGLILRAMTNKTVQKTGEITLRALLCTTWRYEIPGKATQETEAFYQARQLALAA